jgi:hypothetical protein
VSGLPACLSVSSLHGICKPPSFLSFHPADSRPRMNYQVRPLQNPVRYQLALCFALLMQFTGLVGESYILSTLSAENAILKSSISRFIIFDGAGLLLLVLAFLLIKNSTLYKHQN